MRVSGSWFLVSGYPFSNRKPQTRDHQTRLLVGLGALALPLAVYLLTLCPTVYNLDSAELTTGAFRLGIVHATGYPTYLLLGKLFTFLPFGDVGYRVNLMSAVFGSLAATLVYATSIRLGCRPLAALAGALAYAFSYFAWTSAVVAEVYSLHAFFVALVAWLLLHWQASGDRRWLWAAGLSLGLSAGNHATTVLLMPAVLAFAIATGRRRILRLGTLGPALLLLGVGLAVYAYLPIRFAAGATPNLAGHYDATGAFVPVDLTTPAGIWWIISGQMFRQFPFGYPLAELPAQIVTFGRWLWGNELGAGIVLGLLGLVATLRDPDRRAGSIFLGLVFVANAVFFVDYRAVDKDTMFLPVYLVWSVWVAAGFEAFLTSAGTRAPARWVAVALVAALPLAMLAVNWSRADVSGDRRARDWAAEFALAAEQDALVFGYWATISPLQYLQLVEGVRPDLGLYNRFQIAPADLRSLLLREAGRRPIYLLEPDVGLEDVFRFESVPQGYRIERRVQGSRFKVQGLGEQD
ncbi:MAG: DUF2723 domain-containing protein [Chloroflexi bacterium]|nr:DUF2723 domain-containing protein [Chloroflexota bacterium]